MLQLKLWMSLVVYIVSKLSFNDVSAAAFKLFHVALIRQLAFSMLPLATLFNRHFTIAATMPLLNV